MSVFSVQTYPYTRDSVGLGQSHDLVKLSLIGYDDEVSAQILTLLRSLGPADVLPEHLIAVFGGSGARFRLSGACRFRRGIGTQLQTGSRAHGCRRIRRRGRRARIGIKIDRAGGSGGDVVRLLFCLLEILQHGVDNDRHHYQHCAQHQNNGERSPSALFHFFCDLPFSLGVARILNGGSLDRLPCGVDRRKLRVFLFCQLGYGGAALSLEFPGEHFSLLRAYRSFTGVFAVLLMCGGVNLDVLGHGVRCVPGLVAVALFNYPDHHALNIVKVVVTLFEDSFGARNTAEIEVLYTAVEHGSQLIEGLIAVGGLEADAFFNDRTQTAPGNFRRGVILAVHAAQLRVFTLVLQRQMTAVYRVVHEHSYGVDVGRGGKLAVPIELRSDKLQLLPLPGTLTGGADGDAAAVVHAYIIRVDTAAAPSGADLCNDSAAESGDKLAELLTIHFG